MRYRWIDFFFQAEDGIRDSPVTGVQTCALPILCKGSRYNRETLEIKYKDKNIADVLNMTVDEGCEIGRAPCRERV